MSGAKIIQILTQYLSFLFVIEMSPGFTSFHVSMQQRDLPCKFKWSTTYSIHTGFTHMFKEHAEIIDKKNNQNS